MGLSHNLKYVDPGLLKVMETDVVPKLERELPDLPPDADPLAIRFTLVFDREGYSPDFFQRMMDRHIACLTYHKYPKEDWSVEEFETHQVKLVSGHVVEMKLAERSSFIGKQIWVREIRKLTDSGHQTSVLSTNYHDDFRQIAVAMFARWSQENYLKYMREHFNIDRLIDYSTEVISDTTNVVNPAYRTLEGQLRKKKSILAWKKVEYAEIILKEDIESVNVERYLHEKVELKDTIENIEQELQSLKIEKKATLRRITISELPEDQRFKRLGTSRKYFIDVIKMIAYRAETAMVNMIREKMNHGAEARSLLRSLYKGVVDLIPDLQNEQLIIKLHHLANNSSSEVLKFLCEELNDTETVFPGTNLKLCFKLVSD